MNLYNFAAGPAMLAPSVKKALAAMILDWRGTGLSITEVPHREEAFESFLRELQAKVRRLLGVNDGYEVLFLMGGARLLFALIAEQFLKERAAYAVTGYWSALAAKTAERYGEVTTLPMTGHPEGPIPTNLQTDYLFLCSNETIGGVQYATWPETTLPLVIDASSDIFSRRFDMSNVALLMAGAQKNAGIAGVSIVVVRKDWLAQAKIAEPLLSFREHARAENLLVTPPALALGALDATLTWIEESGGVEYFEALNEKKAALIYKSIDESAGFYQNPVERGARSKMNVVFSLRDDSLTKAFLDGAQQRGLLNLKGHRSAGAVRASIYNAMPLEGVEALCEWMADFQKQYDKK